MIDRSSLALQGFRHLCSCSRYPVHLAYLSVVRTRRHAFVVRRHSQLEESTSFGSFWDLEPPLPPCGHLSQLCRHLEAVFELATIGRPIRHHMLHVRLHDALVSTWNHQLLMHFTYSARFGPGNAGIRCTKVNGDDDPAIRRSSRGGPSTLFSYRPHGCVSWSYERTGRETSINQWASSRFQ